MKPTSGKSENAACRDPQKAPQPSCTYCPCQVAVGSLISKWVCGAKEPLTSQKGTFWGPRATLTTADEVTLPGASGTLEKSMPAREEHGATGVTGPASGPPVPADAGPPAPSITATTNSTATRERPRDPSHRFIESPL